MLLCNLQSVTNTTHSPIIDFTSFLCIKSSTVMTKLMCKKMRDKSKHLEINEQKQTFLLTK